MSKRQTFGFTAFHVDFHSAVFSSAYVSNSRPAGQIRPANELFLARGTIFNTTIILQAPQCTGSAFARIEGQWVRCSAANPRLHYLAEVRA